MLSESVPPLTIIPKYLNKMAIERRRTCQPSCFKININSNDHELDCVEGNNE